MPLTEAKLKALKPAAAVYRVADAGGLCIEVTSGGSKLWRYRYRVNGKATMLALGSYPETTLAQARDARDDARRLLRDGKDPAAERQAARARIQFAADNTFRAVAQEWRSKAIKGLAQVSISKVDWQLGLIPDRLQNRPIDEITAQDVLTILRPLEHREIVDTAHRVRARMSQVFRYAVATGRAQRDPTADLRGALTPITSTPRAAVTDPQAVGALLRTIDAYEGQPVTRAALRLAPMLFARPGNLRAMEWGELDLDAAEWRIPAGKMKMREAHVVPLPTQALAILEELHPLTKWGAYVFPSIRDGKRPMSNNTINAALRRLGYDKDTMTAHGFRAMASTRLNELGWSPDVIERQLAHADRNKVRAVYNRAQYMAERTKMMQAWADYLDQLRIDTAKVVPIGKRSGASR
ncbi:tyrosine-type recombinase/integrase [Luteimonas marina]|uniref:Tyrosine-type recombinase/integrase n=1 Tax=Luteimonas marina TaxID=488485 RepID=A0A5C5UCC4_9GAMM|nr:site-specific integrase [Luteimonas marina]TWT23596.1 tyrosine-type recombinase/integrase [Luteimonas marina]